MMASLSIAVSRWFRLQQSSVESHEDIDVFHAPSECHGATSRSLRDQAQALLAELGFSSFDQFAEAVEARTSARWVHFNLMPPEAL